MKKVLLLISFIISLNFVNSMYCVPNQVAIHRGANYSFTAITTEPYHNYYISPNNEQIVYTSSHNNSHIFIDLYVPTIIKILSLYELEISTFDVSGSPVEETTFLFVIGNLTDPELFYILSQYKEREDEIIIKDQEIAILKNETSTNDSRNDSTWDEYDFSTFTEKHGESVFMTILTALCFSVFAVVSIVKIKYTTSIEKEVMKKEKEKAIENHTRSKLSNEAVAYSADIYIEKEVSGEIIEVALLNQCEKNAMDNYVVNCDVTPFLIPTKAQYVDENKSICDSDSIYQFKKYLGKRQADIFDKFHIISALVKYLNATGRKERNDDLFPVRCNISDLKEELAKLKKEKLKQEFKKYKKKSKNPAKKAYSDLQQTIHNAKDVTPSNSQDLTIIDEINSMKNR